MRLFLCVAVLLCACTEGNAPGSGETRTLGFVSQDDAVAAYRRVGEKMEPVAEALCRRENPRVPQTYCDFKLVAAPGAPNARQFIDPRDRRPTILFSFSLLQEMRNDDEIAFIVGHEAGHQIANHLAKSYAQTLLGSGRFAQVAARKPGATAEQIAQEGSLGAAVGAQAFTREREIEADVIGAYLADRAGYDALLGAQSFARFKGGSDAPFSTHPPSSQRLQVVEQVAQGFKKQRAAGQVPRLPRL